MSDNLVREKHLNSLGSAMKNYVNQQGMSGAVLSTTPSTVDGGMWYETTATAPIVKIFHGGSNYFLYTNQLVSPNLSLSSDAVTVESGASQTITLSHSGDGVISLSNPNTTALTAAFDSTTNVLTLTNNLGAGDESTSVNLGVALSEAGTYAADSKTLAVTCQAALLDPQLTVTPSLVEPSATVTATVSYLGTGTISVTPSNGWHDDLSYDANTHTITIIYRGKGPLEMTGEEFTVSLSAADGYDAATATLTVVP